MRSKLIVKTNYKHLPSIKGIIVLSTVKSDEKKCWCLHSLLDLWSNISVKIVIHQGSESWVPSTRPATKTTYSLNEYINGRSQQLSTKDLTTQLYSSLLLCPSPIIFSVYTASIISTCTKTEVYHALPCAPELHRVIISVIY